MDGGYRDFWLTQTPDAGLDIGLVWGCLAPHCNSWGTLFFPQWRLQIRHSSLQQHGEVQHLPLTWSRGLSHPVLPTGEVPQIWVLKPPPEVGRAKHVVSKQDR